MGAPMNARTSLPLGLHFDMPNETYQRSPGVSRTGLSDFEQSPLHYFSLHRDPNRPPRETRAGQLEGTLAHCAVLEPAEFDKRYVVVPEGAPRRPSEAQWNAKNPSADSVSAMAWWTTWTNLNAGRQVITSDLYETAMAQARSARSVPDVAALLSVGRPEVSAFWIDPATGELCRCRPDWVHPVGDRGDILVDVKTCGDASPAEFARQVARKGYHRQDAWYSDGYSLASGRPVLGFVFVAIEATWPYAASAVMLDDAGREKGRADNRALLERFAECNATNTWPGYGPSITQIELPRWAA